VAGWPDDGLARDSRIARLAHNGGSSSTSETSEASSTSGRNIMSLGSPQQALLETNDLLFHAVDLVPQPGVKFDILR
jgi:hypothetical protein